MNKNKYNDKLLREAEELIEDFKNSKKFDHHVKNRM